MFTFKSQACPRTEMAVFSLEQFTMRFGIYNYVVQVKETNFQSWSFKTFCISLQMWQVPQKDQMAFY